MFGYSGLAVLALSWFAIVVGLHITGYLLLLYHYLWKTPQDDLTSYPPRKDLPHVTIIRPCNGLDPYLEECLTAIYLQNYPPEKMSIFFCVHSRTDECFPLLQRLSGAFPKHHTRIFIQDERDDKTLGANPKVRNMSQAYRSATSNLVWILDCNVWVSRGASRRMVDKLEGIDSQPYNLFYHLPIYANVGNKDGKFGSQVEELIPLTAFAKLYTAINFWRVGPCVTGKSTMFRRSDLDKRRCGLHAKDSGCSHTGLDTFSNMLCEDEAIAEFLWDKPYHHRHGLLLGELAIQPVSLRLGEYIGRHVRWVRARKFAFWPGTLLEPLTESLLCSSMAALAFAYYRDDRFWYEFSTFLITSIGIWACVDFSLYRVLSSVYKREGMAFRKLQQTHKTPSLFRWAMAWLCREALALPLWRGRRYVVSLDGKMRLCEWFLN